MPPFAGPRNFKMATLYVAQLERLFDEYAAVLKAGPTSSLPGLPVTKAINLTLEGEPKIWFNNYISSFKTWTQFKADFLDRWAESEQDLWQLIQQLHLEEQADPAAFCDEFEQLAATVGLDVDSTPARAYFSKALPATLLEKTLLVLSAQAQAGQTAWKDLRAAFLAVHKNMGHDDSAISTLPFPLSIRPAPV